MRVVDMFAGLGGGSAGAIAAGAEVLWAGNHWRLAVDTHKRNHPGIETACQDLRQYPWGSLPEYDMLLGSPACQGHSTAANGARLLNPEVAQHHDELRGTAWSVIDCIEVTRPLCYAIEEVPDFLKWAPIDENTGKQRKPTKRMRAIVRGREQPLPVGDYFAHWLEGLKLRGYTAEIYILRASDFGVPQQRDRVFICGRRDGKSIDIKSTTPGEEVPFGPCIDWKDPKPWRKFDKPAVIERVRRSRRRLRALGETGYRFITQDTRDHMGLSLNQSLRTVTTKGHWAIVRGQKRRTLTMRESARAMGFDDSFIIPEIERGKVTQTDVLRAIGNAICPPVMEAITRAHMAA